MSCKKFDKQLLTSYSWSWRLTVAEEVWIPNAMPIECRAGKLVNAHTLSRFLDCTKWRLQSSASTEMDAPLPRLRTSYTSIKRSTPTSRPSTPSSCIAWSTSTNSATPLNTYQKMSPGLTDSWPRCSSRSSSSGNNHCLATAGRTSVLTLAIWPKGPVTNPEIIENQG